MQFKGYTHDDNKQTCNFVDILSSSLIFLGVSTHIRRRGDVDAAIMCDEETWSEIYPGYYDQKDNRDDEPVCMPPGKHLKVGGVFQGAYNQVQIYSVSSCPPADW